MAEERAATMIGGVEAEVRALRQDVTDLKVSVGRLESGFGQMDKRLSNVETAVNELRRDNKQSFFWLLGIVLGTWMSTMWAILSKIR
jgi:hypothetical protein